MSSTFLTSHRCHDYEHLLLRWEALTAKLGLLWEVFAHAGGKLPIIHVRRDPAEVPARVYISAGVHGDEPAAPTGLILWLERHGDQLRELEVDIFPCLNPHGLIENSRIDHLGEDLNRQFHRDGDHPIIGPWKERIHGKNYDLAICLHEDYDAQGNYIYEINRGYENFGKAALQEIRPIIEPEPRKEIEGRAAEDGVIIRPKPSKELLENLPEAIYLHQKHAERTYTFETPSEFSLEDRVESHAAFLKFAINHVIERK